MFSFFSSAQEVFLRTNQKVKNKCIELNYLKTLTVRLTWALGLTRCCQRNIWLCRSTSLQVLPPPAYSDCPGSPLIQHFLLHLWQEENVLTNMKSIHGLSPQWIVIKRSKHTNNLLCQVIFELSICRFKIKVGLKLQGSGLWAFHKELASASVPGLTAAYILATQNNKRVTKVEL